MSLTPTDAFLIEPHAEGVHWIGGPQNFAGATCTACRRPLMRHITLLTSDPLLAFLKCPLPELPLLFCTRCVMHHESFSYALPAPGVVETITEPAVSNPRFNLERQNAEWFGYWQEEGFGDEFAQLNFKLQPMSGRLQELIRIFDEGSLSKTQQQEYAALADLGAVQLMRHPRLIIAQVLGHPYRTQPIDLAPPCPRCKGSPPMRFLVSIGEDDKYGIHLAVDYYFYYAFVCDKCWSIRIDCIL
jgi:hypothetical protein